MQGLGLTGMAGVAVASLLALSAAPGAAAAPIAQASASAITATIAGQTRDSGAYQAVNDGNKETTSGTNRPPLTVLGGQSLITTGTLAQDATTSVENGQGHSAACAGLAGSGASVASAGDAGSCLTGGQAVTLNPGTVDLSKLLNLNQVAVVNNDQLAPLTAAFQQILAQLGNTPVSDAVNMATSQITSALQQALTTALNQLGLSLNVGLGAVQSSCVAGPNSASGTANIVDTGATATVGGQTVNLVNFPANPAPNTHVVTNLGNVATLIENSLSQSLKSTLASTVIGPAGSTIPIPDATQAAALNAAIAQISSQLKPLQDNVIDATLNLQSRASADQITVTALDLKVLPVINQQSGVDAFELQVGTSSCGPSNREAVEAASASATPTPKAKPTHKAKPASREVPTSIPAGAATASGPAGEGHDWGLLALGGLAAIGVGAGGAAWSASRSPR